MPYSVEAPAFSRLIRTVTSWPCGCEPVGAGHRWRPAPMTAIFLPVDARAGERMRPVHPFHGGGRWRSAAAARILTGLPFGVVADAELLAQGSGRETPGATSTQMF